jgi:hypothetical protein
MQFQMTGSAKRRTLILLGLVMVMTMIIAASLPRLEFQAGMPLPRLENGQVVAAPAAKEPFLAISASKFLGIFFGLFLAGSMLYMFYKLLIRGFRWKEVTAVLQQLLFISLIVAGILLLILILPSSGVSDSPAVPVPTAEPPRTAPLGLVPASMLWLVVIGLLAVVMTVGIWILTSASRRAMPIALVGFEAEKALQALKDGLDLKDVIIKCYRQMSLVLEKKRGIKRKDFMTTGEFENLLEAAGFPNKPIHQLTQLFEAVRYGNRQPNPASEQTAIKCLEAIILYSHDQGDGLI